MTYYVKTDDEKFTKRIQEEFQKYDMKPSNKFPVDIAFFSGQASYYRNHVDLKGTKLTNTVRGDSLDILTNKVTLHKQFADKKFILESIELPPIPKLEDKFLKILKPFGGFAGDGITVAENPEEVAEWLNNHPKFEHWILQDYIKSPALKDGKKFHLRVYVLILLKPYKVFMLKQNPYFSAVKPYKKSDWKNTKIHDTHYNEGVQYYFPESLPDGWKTASNKEIIAILASIFSEEKDFIPDWNGKGGYYTFGVDIIFDKRTPILLEINKKMGLQAALPIIPGMVSILLGKEQSDFEQIL
jgi:hypothetical protein